MRPSSFPTRRSPDIESKPIVVRDGIDIDAARGVLRGVNGYEWDSLYHAYGPAADVPPQLVAITVGDQETREEAWWNLWGNIHHQGTIYEATLPAVPVLFALARWRDYPDRAQSLIMVREIAGAEGVVVWRYDADAQIARDKRAEHAAFAELRTELVGGTRHLAAYWRTEPPDVRRALLWLLSTVPEVRVHYHELVDETLPDEHRRGWDTELAGYPASEEEEEAVEALERWVFYGD